MTPATIDEIFYRQITDIDDDTLDKLLTLYTIDVILTDLVEEGSASITEDSMILEISTNGTITVARAVEKAWGLPDTTILLPRIGYSLDGATFRESVLSITAEECHFWLDSSLEAGFDISRGEIERFTAVAHGNVEAALVCNASVSVSEPVNITLYDLPVSLQPKTIVRLRIGVVPVFVEVGLDLTLVADLHAEASLNFEYGFRQNIETAFGGRYENEEVDWVRKFSPSPTDIVSFDDSIDGKLGLGITLNPSIYALVYSAGGIEVCPSIRGGARLVIEEDDLAGYLKGNVNWQMGLTGWAFEWMDPIPSVSFPVWANEWKLFPAESNLIFVTQPESQIISVGDSAYFSCAVSPEEGVDYQWYHNGIMMPEQTLSSFGIAECSESHAGDYFVVATVENQSTNSEIAVMEIVDSSVPWIVSHSFNTASKTLTVYFSEPMGTYSSSTTGEYIPISTSWLNNTTLQIAFSWWQSGGLITLVADGFFDSSGNQMVGDETYVFP